MNYFLVGRPNVGKSSIFNLFSHFNRNIIHKNEGTTRDWHKEIIRNTSSYIFDTPGLIIDKKKNNIKILSFFNKKLITDIDFFLYVIDYKSGYNQLDLYIINQFRKYNKQIILLINKFDNIDFKINNEFEKYGIKLIFYLSCSHMLGINDICKLFKKNDNKNNKIIKKEDYSIAIFGKPNVGKSTFLNSLLGFKRSVTSKNAGTTSDFVVDFIQYKQKYIKFIDTAGIGKKSNILSKSINYYSTKKTFDNIRRVDSAFIIIDSVGGIDRQDKRVINYISDKSKSIILIFNKIDLIKDKINFKKTIVSNLLNNIKETKNIKFFFINSLNKKDPRKVLKYFYNFENNSNVISTSHLNKWLSKAINENPHPLIDRKKVNFKYAVQVKEKPVTIKIFSNYAQKIKISYKRYLLNNFNNKFKILNQKTNIIYSSSKNPYV
ncbi:ribosome biogenesis GTPase Der [Alphaproteobacteria bacterium]|nr:ribosome biogenesis GTPase Der [Alphaproteobacteria bacterium]